MAESVEVLVLLQLFDGCLYLAFVGRVWGRCQRQFGVLQCIGIICIGRVPGFWKAALMKDQSLVEMAKSEEAMGHFGKITSLKDLPSDKKIIGYIKEAMQLNEAGTRSASTPQ